MLIDDGLTIGMIREVFAEELREAGGGICDKYEDERRLFARAILPWVEEVRPRDRVKGGVALKALGREVWVHPYVFREVCSNGAIAAHAIQTRHLRDLDQLVPVDACREMREAVRGCCVEEAFSAVAEEMRTAQEAEADVVLNMLPLLSRLPSELVARVLVEVTQRFEDAGDRSRFGLMNAVTSRARDTRDPELRWRLEELGGGIAAIRVPCPAPAPARAGAELALVG